MLQIPLNFDKRESQEVEYKLLDYKILLLCSQ